MTGGTSLGIITAPDPAQRSEPEQADDSGAGLAMLLVFSVAILTVTGAVALLALVHAWWMLGLAFAVHVGMTAIVTTTIVRSMSARTPTEGRVGSEAAPTGSRADVPSPRRPVAVHP